MSFLPFEPLDKVEIVDMVCVPLNRPMRGVVREVQFTESNTMDSSPQFRVKVQLEIERHGRLKTFTPDQLRKID